MPVNSDFSQWTLEKVHKNATDYAIALNIDFQMHLCAVWIIQKNNSIGM